MVPARPQQVRTVKSLNSSVVLVADDEGREWLLLGKGIGFGRRPGDTIDSRDADRAFVPLNVSGNLDAITTLSFLTPERLAITEELVEFAEKKLGGKLNPHILVALTDHLAFVLERATAGTPVTTPTLSWDVRDLYPQEFAAAAEALGIVEERTGIALPPQEAVSIALHLVNASQTTPDMPRIARLSEFLGWLSGFIGHLNADSEPKGQARLIRHGRLMYQRLLDNEQLSDDVGELVHEYEVRNPVVATHLQVIVRHVSAETGQILTDEERLHLALHLKPVVKEIP